MQKRSYTNHKKRGTTDKLLYALPATALLMMAGMGVAKYTLADNVSAMLTPAMTNSTSVGVMSDLSLGVTLDGNTIMRIIPTAGGKFAQTTVGVTVNTSNTFGYDLSMYAYEPNSTTPTTSLTNTAAPLSGDSYWTIDTLVDGSSYTAAEFESSSDTVNKWGYMVGGASKFSAVKETTNFNGSETNGSNRETVTFGAKIDNTIPNGYYQATLNFVAVTKEPTAADERSTFENAFAYAGISLYDGEHYAMQDMSAPICNAVYYNADDKTGSSVKSIQLVDKRDGKLYWVSKLADGKCWMTQNLDFNITGTELNSTTTNLVAYEGDDAEGTGLYTTANGYRQANGITYWKPSNTSVTIVTSRDDTGPKGQIDGWVQTNTLAYSVDAGEWYQTNNYFSSNACNNVGASVGCNFLDGSRTKATATDGSENVSLSTYFSDNAGGDNMLEHRSLGNWYNWTAAIAANDSTNVKSAGTYKNSVCPAGWGLPEDGMYGTLNTIYNSTYSSTADEKDKGLMAAPFYGVRGGVVYLSGGLTTLYDAGRVGNYWSSTSVSVTNARHLSFRSDYVSPSYSNSRYYGLSVRCLAL